MCKYGIGEEEGGRGRKGGRSSTARVRECMCGGGGGGDGGEVVVLTQKTTTEPQVEYFG